MWGHGVDERKLTRTDTGNLPAQNAWHRGDAHDDADRMHPPHEPAESEESLDKSGTWGEKDVGGINEEGAKKDFEDMRTNLTNLERTRTQDTQRSLKRTASGASATRQKSKASARPPTANTNRETEGDGTDIGGDLEAAKDDDEDDFELDRFWTYFGF